MAQSQSTFIMTDGPVQAAAPEPTDLVFHRDAKRYTLTTSVEAVLPFAALVSANQALFKPGTADDHAVVTRATIFHPQGGGQPSDVGTMTAADGSVVFAVAAARMDAVQPGRVLHFGRFVAADAEAEAGSLAFSPFSPGTQTTQAIDVDKRLLFSRLHTAGHVLGAAVRHLLEAEVPGFDELKASHFPDAASCEFRGRIDGAHKGPIQVKVDDYIARAMPVRIDWWDPAEFRRRGLQRLLPDTLLASSSTEKLRVVTIVGAESYPCGGTHVDTTDLCGPTTVTKISRSKGTSRVSYAVA